jgi:hypothetical protein
MRSVEIPRMTSEEFRAKNRIFFEAKVYDGPEAFEKLKDSIDLDGNNRTDYIERGAGLFGGKIKRQFTEPILVEPYSKIEELAKAYETEVVTQDNISDVKIKDSEDTYRKTATYPLHIKRSDGNVRSISELLKKEAPYSPDAKWAFDTRTHSFIIFEPRE